MHIPILIGIINKRSSNWENCHIFLRNELLKINFWHEAQIYANFLTFILTIYRQRFLFRFLIPGMQVHIPILIVVQNGHSTSWKIGHILLKNVLFEAYFPKWRSVLGQFLVLYSHYLRKYLLCSSQVVVCVFTFLF